jgi:hypothetical protein
MTASLYLLIAVKVHITILEHFLAKPPSLLCLIRYSLQNTDIDAHIDVVVGRYTKLGDSAIGKVSKSLTHTVIQDYDLSTDFNLNQIYLE